MADPTIQTFCCHFRNQSSTTAQLMSEFSKENYIAICLFSSSLGIIGSLYQIFLRKEISYTEVGGRRIYKTGRRIIIWLAIADLLASLGILVRSAIWRHFQNVFADTDDTAGVLFCAISSGWCQYFYTCTWLWTCCYAINTRCVLHRRPISTFTFHLITWTCSAFLTLLGLFVLYYPDADCHEVTYFSTALTRILPNYCVTYLPIALVMILNPILYVSSTKEIDRQLSLTLNQVTARERELLHTFKLKFSLINVVFYICWLPNLINGIILWSLWHKLPTSFIILMWYIMAIANPLQGFFNALVYRQWDRNHHFRSNTNRVTEIYNENQYGRSNERSPLLHSTSSHNLQTEMVDTGQRRVDTKFSVNLCCNS